jgi:hypothetical protein
VGEVWPSQQGLRDSGGWSICCNSRCHLLWLLLLLLLLLLLWGWTLLLLLLTQL